MSRVHPQVRLKNPPKGALRYAHPWIYRTQIASVSEDARPGSLVSVMGPRGCAGTGYFNPDSEITVRLLSRGEEKIDAAFFRSRAEKALRFRARHVRETNAYRLISSEADDLPGLIVDRYGEILVVQFLTLGMDALREQALQGLSEAVPSKGIYERSDSSSRRIEGLEERTGWISRECGEEVEIFEGPIRYKLRFGQGHKTGFYLDQRDSRLLFPKLGIRGRVLDAFCYEGGFGLHLAAAGCQVLGVDIQAEAVARAEENRLLNGIPSDRLVFRTANVFDELKTLEKAGEKFDMVILDPPSFVKKKSALEGALAGYKEILLRGMRILKDGGLLAPFSCSYHVDEMLLLQSVMSAARDTRRSIKILQTLRQSADHPVSPFIPETYYLKGFLFEVSDLV